VSAVVIQDQVFDRVLIPGWVKNLDSFCRWASSEEYPEHGWFSYLNGSIWVDLSMEEMNHNQVKGVFAIVVGGLILAGRLGRYFHDRMGLSNPGANLATEPDGMFVSRKSLRVGRARLVLGKGDSPIRIEGTPDMTLEVVSPSSVYKDTVELLDLYWRAGIREYWLVDPRGKSVAFDILCHTATGYVAAPKQRGWIPSAVFGKSFKLTQKTNLDGYPEYRLAVR
jgi:Uma2 family endonuclease